MYLTAVLVIVVVAVCAAAVAWYYNRAFESVHHEYLGSAGQVDDIYLSLVRPLRLRRLVAVCIATVAFCVIVMLIGLHKT
jgi:ABC-type Fe3+-siderophore transport system permease subunit